MAIRKKTGGRIAGTPNRTTASTKEKLQKIVNEELEKLGKIIDKLEPIDRVNAVSKLLTFLLPRPQETTLKGDKENPLVINNSEDREKRIAELIAKAQSK
ncbi:hypothetical protein [Flavobacterium sp. GSP6]|uniref:hypothetical protein n=1 Tax=Flavobacterium sp. GSP6 TaxID=2497488 RepID=UPI000F868076|nr:hypothetical protein [Flavobacterium sp. GSP6]RTZ03698.1 hypothetical protein EKM03_13120 [Flavobacterium sp. GSP6]